MQLGRALSQWEVSDRVRLAERCARGGPHFAFDRFPADLDGTPAARVLNVAAIDERHFVFAGSATSTFQRTDSPGPFHWSIVSQR